MPCYKAARKGERRRKAVRGCIVGPDIAALSLAIVKVCCYYYYFNHYIIYILCESAYY